MIQQADSPGSDSPCACNGGCGSCGRAGKPGWWIGLVLVLLAVGALLAKVKEWRAGGPSGEGAPSVVAEAGSAAQQQALPRLVDLGAGTCIPCKMMMPVLEDLRKTYAGRLDVQFIDVRENPEEGRKYGIKVIPTQIFQDAAGVERFRHEGFLGKDDILAKWKDLGVELGGNSGAGSPKSE